MKDVNKVILIGRLGADPVQKETKNGLAVAAFSLATSWKGREEGVTQTQWHRVVAWGKQAQVCSTYLRKGNTVYVEGSLRSRKYEAKDGTSRMAFEVHMEQMRFLDGRRGQRQAVESETEVSETESSGSEEMLAAS